MPYQDTMLKTPVADNSTEEQIAFAAMAPTPTELDRRAQLVRTRSKTKPLVAGRAVRRRLWLTVFYLILLIGTVFLGVYIPLSANQDDKATSTVKDASDANIKAP